MGRRSERLSREGLRASEVAGDTDVIQVVSRAFDVLRCFEGHDARLGNLEIASRCKLPRSTVSRLTHTLTRMGQLVYIPTDQKYRIGPSAVAMSTSVLRGLHLRNLIRLRLQEVAELVPGTIGFVVPDRLHMVYLEYARAANTLGLNSSVGTRISTARTAAGHAYTAALEPSSYAALRAEIARESGEDAALLDSVIDANRQSLAQRGYVTAGGHWSPHINGIALPIWSPQYQTYVVVTIGMLAAMYDDARLHGEVAPHLLGLRESIGSLVAAADAGLEDVRSFAPTAAALQPTTTEEKKPPEDFDELATGTRRTRPTRSIRAGDGRR